MDHDQNSIARHAEDRSLRNSLLSPEELAHNLGISTATLATWRSRGHGPSYLKVGRVIWYPKTRVERWMESQTRELNGTEKSQRNMALQVQAPRQGICTEHRFGRHKVKHQRGAADRERTSQDTDGRQAPVPANRGKTVQ